MIVCHCHAMTDRDIRRAAHCGARSADELALRCEAGADCGTCVSTIQSLLDAEHKSPARRVITELAAHRFAV